VKTIDFYDDGDLQMMEECILCPRECMVNRLAGETGYCGTDAGLNISSICVHRGEEPVISGKSGICNIFFAGCNLRCIYCQNFEISQSRVLAGKELADPDKVLDQIGRILSEGVSSVGFVSPSHVVPQVKAIINGLNKRGLHPTIVYNTNSYEKAETIRSLSEMIDVYLPDYKYVSAEIAMKYSDARDYPEVALRAIREMYYQKGSVLAVDENGKAERGMLIRHLVLPGNAQESKNVLKSVSEELSAGVHISLMSQYYPAFLAGDHPELGRSIHRDEYEDVVNYMEWLGFRNGWIQEMSSNQDFRPDFRRDYPFEAE
jgi:putative pyruvate formate lyase activating enzyme